MFKKILCPVDGSEHARKALGVAIDMARRYEAGLVLVHALLRSSKASELQHFAEIEGLGERIGPEAKRLRALEGRLDIGPSYDERLISSRILVELGQHLLDDAKRDAEEAGVPEIETVLVDGDPADRILRCVSEKDVDCIVMGTRGLGEIKGMFVGSVSHKVSSHAPCTCVTVK